MKLQSNRWMRIAAAASAAIVPVSTVSVLSAGASTPVNVNVIGYSIVAPAYKALEAAFQATTAGHNVTFTNSFGASDTQTSNVINGQPADFVNLSYGPNITALVTAHKVPANWTSQELSVAGVNTTNKTTFTTAGVVTDSVVVFDVRSGNPLHIKTWADLLRKGVQIVTPNPLTSGSAKWNLLAGYSSQISLHKTANASQDYLKALLENTISQPVSGSAAMSAFVAGTGNVLIDYEDSSIAALAAGKPIKIVTPAQSLLIENPVALTSTGVTNSGAKAFYKYVFSAAGQGIFANLGFRSVLKTVWASTKNKFPAFTAATSLNTVEKLDPKAWQSLDPKFFGATIKFSKTDSTHPTAGIVSYLEQFAGKTA
jgi:ABC-type sulfate transport system substrate-binding protein